MVRKFLKAHSKSSIEAISRSVIGRKFESAFDGENGIGT
jgi:hypothetical protein